MGHNWPERKKVIHRWRIGLVERETFRSGKDIRLLLSSKWSPECTYTDDRPSGFCYLSHSLRNVHRSIQQCSEEERRLNKCCDLWVNINHNERTYRHIPRDSQTHIVYTRLIVKVLVEGSQLQTNRWNYLSPKSPADSPLQYLVQPPQVSAESETLGSSSRVWEEISVEIESFWQ